MREVALEPVEPGYGCGDGARVRTLGIGGAGLGFDRRHEEDALPGMIESDDGVEHQEQRIRDVAFSRMAVGNRLEEADRVVGEIADRAARERWQLGVGAGLWIDGQAAANQQVDRRQRRAVPPLPPALGPHLHERLAGSHAHAGERIRAEEGVAGDRFSALDALEQKRLAARAAACAGTA